MNIEDVKIIELDLSVRSINGLTSNDILTVGELIRYSKEDLLKMRNVTKSKVLEVEKLLNEFKLKLNEDN